MPTCFPIEHFEKITNHFNLPITEEIEDISKQIQSLKKDGLHVYYDNDKIPIIIKDNVRWEFNYYCISQKYDKTIKHYGLDVININILEKCVYIEFEKEYTYGHGLFCRYFTTNKEVLIKYYWLRKELL